MILVAGVVAIAFWTLVLMILEEQFIYYPHKYPDGYYDHIPPDLPVMDHWVTAEDGTRLHAWLVRSDSSKGILLLSHGNAGNVSHRLDLVRRLYRAGLSVFLYDYRGYGRSDGSPSEDGVYMDARSAYDYLTNHMNVPPLKIILFGRSLGGAVTVDLATHRTSAGMILESTFSSAPDMARVLYPFLPVTPFLRTRFDSEKKIKTVHVPLLVIHGTSDTIVPIRLGEKLFAAANEPKEFYRIPQGDHNDSYVVGGPEYLFRIKAFADSVTARSPLR